MKDTTNGLNTNKKNWMPSLTRKYFEERRPTNMKKIQLSLGNEDDTSKNEVLEETEK